jgi:EAL domain-containing protein (putative c-di-GMP-specific phosphodiesterase class I)
VRGVNGESALSILDRLTDEIRYQFDQASRVMAIKTAGALFERKDLRLSINFMPNAVYEPTACIQKTLAAAKSVDFPSKNLMFEFTENERMVDPFHVQNIIEVYRKLGFWTALDDFGAGYAGLRLLSRCNLISSRSTWNSCVISNSAMPSRLSSRASFLWRVRST